MAITISDTVLDATGTPVAKSQIRITTLQAVSSAELEPITLVSDADGKIEFCLVQGRYRIHNITSGKERLLVTVTVTEDMVGSYTFEELAKLNGTLTSPQITELTKEVAALRQRLDELAGGSVTDLIERHVTRKFIDKLYKRGKK